VALVAGMRLGPYEILAPLGGDGMCEVYRARDTRLHRAVALKTLVHHLSSSPELRRRFEREARMISSLSHPHICTLFDVGQEAGLDFLVMEYLEGETLAHRLARGYLSPEHVLQYGIQIADALEQAHRQGVIHRDLKPGNIMLTKSGVKLLDFGLAKLAAPEPSPVTAALSQLATEDSNLTDAGVIIGTFQYMSPEQLEGKEADARTDIFALGAILYEMATGKPSFTGKSRSQPDCLDFVVGTDVYHRGPAHDTSRARSRSQNLPGKRSRRALADSSRLEAAAEGNRGRRVTGGSTTCRGLT
jgi:eukaryotic-like serine/threonine-protein kinase